MILSLECEHLFHLCVYIYISRVVGYFIRWDEVEDLQVCV